MKGIRVCLLILAIICVSVKSDYSGEKFLSEENYDSLFQDISSMSEEELYIFRMFLEDPSGSVPVPVPTPSPSIAVPSTWDNIISTFSALTNKWTMIVNNFKTTRSSTIKETLLGKGFTYFSQSAQMQISKGIKGQYIDNYLTHLETRIKVPAERQEDLKMVLEESKWADSNVWTAFNTLFSVDNGGNTKFASILISRNDVKDTYDFVFTDIKADFKLAPDTLVVSKKLSVLGGIWTDDKDEMIKVPKTLTPEDITTVLSFFQIVAFKGFAEQFGIKLEFPKMN